MDTMQIRVPVLGAQDDALFCSPDLFFRAACRLGGNPLFEPPPFACPCTDGIIIIYTLRCDVDGGVDIHGGYIRLSKSELTESLFALWCKAQKPTDTTTMLKRMGFDEVRTRYLN